jgi:hypothetical protein
MALKLKKDQICRLNETHGRDLKYYIVVIGAFLPKKGVELDGWTLTKCI